MKPDTLPQVDSPLMRALIAVLDWNQCDLDGHEDITPDLEQLIARRNLIVECLAENNMPLWRIGHSDKGPDPEWWSNEEGWTETEGNSTIFTDHERNTLNLPVDGYWLKIEAIKPEELP